jgi:lipid IVA palmitoyltransferase
LNNRLVALLLIGGVLACGSPIASADGFSDDLAYKIERSKSALDDGRWDLYLTGYAWHAPYAYSKEKRDELNDASLGGGLGRSVVDPDGDKHSLYGMIFRDSHYKPQYTAGYAWMTYWPAAEKLDFGLGYTVFLFARSDIANYFPLPLAAPLASVRYGNVELMATAIPGIAHDSGNIGFVFVRWNLN